MPRKSRVCSFRKALPKSLKKCQPAAMFNGLAFSRPIRTDLKYLDALPVDAECKINVLTKMCRRSTHSATNFSHRLMSNSESVTVAASNGDSRRILRFIMRAAYVVNMLLLLETKNISDQVIRLIA